MRDFKFRAWFDVNDNRKGMYYFGIDDFDSDDGSQWVDADRGYLDYSDMIKCPIMQYTGLKDKNGKEIYEGDLIKTGEMIYQIAWYGMDARLMPFTTESITTNQYIASSGVPIRSWNWLDGGQGIYYHDIKKSVKVEIIGNIYEGVPRLK